MVKLMAETYRRKEMEEILLVPEMEMVEIYIQKVMEEILLVLEMERGRMMVEICRQKEMEGIL